MPEDQKIVLPHDAREALRAAGVLAAFNKLPPDQQREYVKSIAEGEGSETRQARIEKIVFALRGAKS